MVHGVYGTLVSNHCNFFLFEEYSKREALVMVKEERNTSELYLGFLLRECCFTLVGRNHCYFCLFVCLYFWVHVRVSSSGWFERSRFSGLID